MSVEWTWYGFVYQMDALVIDRVRTVVNYNYWIDSDDRYHRWFFFGGLPSAAQLWNAETRRRNWIERRR